MSHGNAFENLFLHSKISFQKYNKYWSTSIPQIKIKRSTHDIKKTVTQCQEGLIVLILTSDS